MSDGDWGESSRPWWVVVGVSFIGATVLAAIIYAGITTSQNWKQSQYNTQQIREKAEQDIGVRCVGLDGLAAEKCKADAYEPASAQERDEADLYAQRQMVVWAFIMAVAALVSIPLSLIGILFVWRTLSLNRSAVLAANRSVAAAIRANQHTQDGLRHERQRTEKELRPYVLVEGAGVSSMNDKKYTPQVIVHMKNFGKVPASSVNINYEYVFAASEHDVKFSKQIMDPRKVDKSGLVLGPNAEKYTHMSVKRASWEIGLESLKQGIFELYVVGQITYYDPISRCVRDTGFKLQYTKKDGKVVDTNDFSVCETGNYFN